MLIPISVLAAAVFIAWTALKGSNTDVAIGTEVPTATVVQEPTPTPIPPTSTPVPSPTALVLPTAIPIEPTPTPEELAAEVETEPEPTVAPVPTVAAPAPTTPPAPAPTTPPAPAPAPTTPPAQPAAGDTTGGTAPAPGTDGSDTADTDGTDSENDPTVAAPPAGTQIHCTTSGAPLPERLSIGNSVAPLSVLVNPMSAKELFDFQWDFGVSQPTGATTGRVTFSEVGRYPIKVTATAKADGSMISTGCGIIEVFDPRTEVAKVTCSTKPADAKKKAADAELRDPMRTTVSWKPSALELNLHWDYGGNNDLVLQSGVKSPQSRQSTYSSKDASIKVTWINPLDQSTGIITCPIFPS